MAYTDRPLRPRPGQPASLQALFAHTAYWAAFGFAAAMVLGLIG